MTRIKHVIIDVDGTMTDGGIYYDEHGNELKKFCTRDAAGFFVLSHYNVEVLILTGRECAATLKRMKDLGIENVYQGVKDKYTFIKSYMSDNNIHSSELAYLGDDLNDLPSMKLAGVIGCPADACKEVRKIADYISTKKGGDGAVRDIIENYLVNDEDWQKAVMQVYKIGV